MIPADLSTLDFVLVAIRASCICGACIAVREFCGKDLLLQLFGPASRSIGERHALISALKLATDEGSIALQGPCSVKQFWVSVALLHLVMQERLRTMTAC